MPDITLEQAKEEIIKELKKHKLMREGIAIVITLHQTHTTIDNYSSFNYGINISSMSDKHRTMIKVPSKHSLAHALELMKLKIQYEGKNLLLEKKQ